MSSLWLSCSDDSVDVDDDVDDDVYDNIDNNVDDDNDDDIKEVDNEDDDDVDDDTDDDDDEDENNDNVAYVSIDGEDEHLTFSESKSTLSIRAGQLWMNSRLASNFV